LSALAVGGKKEREKTPSTIVRAAFRSMRKGALSSCRRFPRKKREGREKASRRVLVTQGGSLKLRKGRKREKLGRL